MILTAPGEPCSEIRAYFTPKSNKSIELLQHAFQEQGVGIIYSNTLNYLQLWQAS